MFATGHKPLIDDLGSIVAASIDVDAFFHNGIGSSSQRFANLVSTRLNLRLLASRGVHFYFEVVASKLGDKVRMGGDKKIAVGCPAERREARWEVRLLLRCVAMRRGYVLEAESFDRW